MLFSLDQLVAIIRGIFEVFDDGLEIRSVFFFYVSKAFDKVWHEGTYLKITL